jgi:hypothetical protein
VDQISQPILGVLQFRVVPEPAPIQIGVRTQNPRQSFDQACVQIVLQHGAENDLGWIAPYFSPNVLETRIAERRRRLLKLEVGQVLIGTCSCNDRIAPAIQ